MNVVVVGAGKMGLPLACQFGSRGATVTACDRQPRIVDAINAGQCPIGEPGVAPLVARLVAEGRLRATTDTGAAVSGADVVVVIVPVLLTPDRRADFSIIEHATRDIAGALRPGTMVCYETTLPVGQTRRLAALLEGPGRRAGVDFNLVFSPERIKSDTILATLPRTPKVIGGLTPACAQRGVEFYGLYLGAQTIRMDSLEASEFVKLAGMLYRDVNIALANELARYAEARHLDLHAVIAAANTDDESALLRPGIGVGGHCTPVYPYFAIRDAEQTPHRLRLSELAREVNDTQPAHVLDGLAAAWRPLAGERVLILGLAFRPQVKEHILSPAFLLRDELIARGAHPLVHDPLYTPEEIRGIGFEPATLDGDVPPAWILNTAHDVYTSLDFGECAARGLEAVADGRACWRPDVVAAAGVIYVGVGRPAQANPRVVSQ